MELISFKSDHGLAKEFIDFGYDLNDRDPEVVLPLRSATAPKVMPSSTMYAGGDHDMRHFMLRKGDRTVGRVSAFVNRALRDTDGTCCGSVGLFECVNDYAVADRLLTAAVEWLHGRHGLKRVWGPLDFDIWHGYRFMIRGFNRPPFVGEPRNKRYYPEFFERFGFSIKAEWDSLEVSGRERIAGMIGRGAQRYQLLKDRGYRFEPLTTAALGGADDRLQAILTRSFSAFPGFTPLNRQEGRALLRQARTVFDPRLGLLAYNEGHDLVGFALACTEPGAAYRPCNGSLSLGNRLACHFQNRSFKTINFYLGGAAPEELRRRSGLGRAGFYAIIKNALDLGCETLLLTLRRKGNHAHGLAARSATPPQREYALYEWNHE